MIKRIVAVTAAVAAVTTSVVLTAGPVATTALVHANPIMGRR